MTDLQELIKRIMDFTFAYRDSGYKSPLFRITPYEYRMLLKHIMDKTDFVPSYYGDIPHFFGADYELVGAPVLFGGKHIRSDDRIEVQE